MQCNIDRTGQRIRVISGSICVVLGIGLLLAGVFDVFSTSGAGAGVWIWVLTGVLILGGGFQIYEGCCAWCVLRAIGIKTKF